MAGTLVAAGSVGAQTTLEPVDSYSGSQAYSGVAVVDGGSPSQMVVAGWSNQCNGHKYDATDMISGFKLPHFDIPGYAPPDRILDNASADSNSTTIYSLIEDSNDIKVIKSNAYTDGIQAVIDVDDIYDHLAAVQIGTDDYLILVEKDDNPSPHYRIWKVDDPGKGWEGDAVSLPSGDLWSPNLVFISDSDGAGAYLSSNGDDESLNIQDTVLGLNFGSGIVFFKDGKHLDQRITLLSGISGAQDVAFNPDYSNNTTEVYVSTNNGEVARLEIQGGGGNLPIYVNPVATITGDTEGSESIDDPSITIQLSRHPNDKSDTLSTVPPVPEVPITVEYSIGGTATRGVGQDYTIDGE